MIHGTNLQPIVAVCQQLICADNTDTLQPMVAIKDKIRVEFARRFNEALDRYPEAEKGRHRRSWVAKKWGVSIEAARKWLTGESLPDMARLALIATDLNVLADSLFRDNTIAISDNSPPPGYIRFKLLDIAAGANLKGGMIVGDHAEVVQFLDVADWWVGQNLPKKYETIDLITAHGNSMQPNINNGDVLFVDKSVNYFDTPGVYLINWRGHLLVKRLIPLLGENKILIKSDNAEDGQEKISPEDIDDLHICGRVIANLTVKRV